MFAGDTDYTGVGLDDILAHLRAWRDGLEQADLILGNIRKRLANFGQSPLVCDGLEYLDSFRDLFSRYHSDLERVVRELPLAVRRRHVETLRQLFESSRSEENYCVRFKQRHHLDALSESNSVQMTLGEIYAFTRDEVVNLRDIGNLVHRLEAFVTDEVSLGSSAVIDLKPNFMGVGVNLNHVWERWGLPRWRRWKQRAH